MATIADLILNASKNIVNSAKNNVTSSSSGSSSSGSNSGASGSSSTVKPSGALIGSAVGSVAGGPLGSVAGAALGSVVDRVTGNKPAYSFGATSGSGSTSSGNAMGTVSSTGSYTQKYTPGTNAALDAALKPYQDQYNAARAAGDAAGMQAANNAANQLRNQYGYAAENAYVDIGKVAGTSGGTSGSTGYWTSATNQAQQNPIGDYSNYLEEMYEAQRRQAIAQLNSAYQGNLNALDQSTVGVDAQYQNARNQAAGASELSARNFAEYAAASGLNSGAAGQAELARNVALQNDLTSLAQNEADFYSNIELQKQQAEIDYNNAIAEAEASNDYAAAQALYQEKVRVQNALIEQQIQQIQTDLQKQSLALQAAQQNTANQQWQQQFDYNRQTTETDRLISLGQSMLDAGLMPSSDALSAMGITSQQAQQYIDYVNLVRSLQTQQQQAQLSAYTSGGSSRSSSGSKSSSGSSSKTASASGSGSYSGSSGSFASSGTSGSASGTQASTTGTTYGSGLDDVTYRGVRQTINTYLGQGKPGSAAEFLNRYADQMNQAQISAITALFNERGYNLNAQ